MADILWVDDDAVIFPSISFRLEALGATIHACYSVREALDWVTSNGPEVVRCLILDVLVPLGEEDDISRQRLLEGRPALRRRYSGLLVLDRFPELASRAVLLTSVPRGKVLDEWGDEGLKYVAKLDPGTGIEDALLTIVEPMMKEGTT
jgi:CheY-like chemotaxis protein